MTAECLIKGSSFACEFGLQQDVLLSQHALLFSIRAVYSFKSPTKDLPHTNLAAFMVYLIFVTWLEKKKDPQRSPLKAFLFLFFLNELSKEHSNVHQVRCKPSKPPAINIHWGLF